MTPPLFHRRGRVLASSTAVAALALAGLSAGSPAVQAAALSGDCATAYPVAEIVNGAAVKGLTVSSGTTPEPFTGTVIGVLDDGIAADVDMIIMRLTSPEIDRVGGIWQGMSGSPVYAADGRLIGAVSYGLSWGSSPVAGVTPFENMDDYLPATSPRRVSLGGPAIKAITQQTDVTRKQAQQGLRQLKMPLGISGVSDSRLAQIQKTKGKHKWLSRDNYAMSASASAGTGAGPESIVAGGNLAASLSYGDVTQAGVGTATSVCNGRVVGFGHPMTFSGKTTLSLHPASALYIQEDSLGAPFKVGNLGAPVGTITDDHMTGITGAVGALPASTRITSTVTYGARSRSGYTNYTLPAAGPMTVLIQQMTSHDRVLDGWIKGSELNSYTITGRNPSNNGFTLQWVDRYQSSDDLSQEGAWELAEFVYGLTDIPGVTITSIKADSTVVDDSAKWEVSSIEQRRGRDWVKISKKEPARIKAGTTLKARVVLKGQGGTIMVPVSYPVPRKAAGSRAALQVLGGNYTWSDTSFTTVAKARKVLKAQVRNDAVQVEFATWGAQSQSGGDSDEYSEDGDYKPSNEDSSGSGMGPRGYSFDLIKQLPPTDRVVDGSAMARVDIR